MSELEKEINEIVDMLKVHGECEGHLTPTKVPIYYFRNTHLLYPVGKYWKPSGVSLRSIFDRQLTGGAVRFHHY